MQQNTEANLILLILFVLIQDLGVIDRTPLMHKNVN